MWHVQECILFTKQWSSGTKLYFLAQNASHMSQTLHLLHLMAHNSVQWGCLFCITKVEYDYIYLFPRSSESHHSDLCRSGELQDRCFSGPALQGCRDSAHHVHLDQGQSRETVPHQSHWRQTHWWWVQSVIGVVYFHQVFHQVLTGSSKHEL